jgi:diaminopimelate decarboxylase
MISIIASGNHTHAPDSTRPRQNKSGLESERWLNVFACNKSEPMANINELSFFICNTFQNRKYSCLCK